MYATSEDRLIEVARTMRKLEAEVHARIAASQQGLDYGRCPYECCGVIGNCCGCCKGGVECK